VDNDTVYQAASLSKPTLAPFAVMQLIPPMAGTRTFGFSCSDRSIRPEDARLTQKTSASAHIRQQDFTICQRGRRDIPTDTFLPSS